MRLNSGRASVPQHVTIALIFLAAGGLACGLTSSVSTPTGEPSGLQIEPTSVEAPLPTSTTRSLAKPTQEKSATAEVPLTTGSLELQNQPYVHPSQSFSLFPPLGWTLEERGASATWSDTETSSSIDVFVNTTGYQLAPDAFDRFVAANETNYFQAFDSYQVLDRSRDNFGAEVVLQSLSAGGSAYRVTSIYYEEKDVIYEVDFWADAEVADAYAPAFTQIWQDMGVSVDSASANVTPYAFVYTFTDPGGYFSFDVPYVWRHDVYSETYAVVDTFWSPDELAYVENIKYDDGTTISKSLSGSFALDLLHKYYASDVKISSDKVQPDGSERLMWNSPSAGQTGMSFFETRGTTFLMLTLSYDDSVGYVYSPVFDSVLASYAVP
jgi:hypothetical protein